MVTSPDASSSSPLAWLTMNKAITENQRPLEFYNHRFLIDLYADMHPDIVVKKSAQVGESVERILKALWCCKYLGANVIYVLPTNNVVKDFVAPKVNPLINSNPFIAKTISKDSESLKQVGERFIYFKGAFSERDAIAISGDILILDELDRMPNMAVVNTYDSRLQASSFGYRWRLSNPSAVGFGVDALYTDSDQRHFFMRCHHCNHNWYMDFEKTYNNNHYVDRERKVYACGKCGKELGNEDRRLGEWVAKYPSRYRHGYWIHQGMAPWVSAKRILEQYEESSKEFFENYVMGNAYTPSDLIVNRETILRACSPSSIQRTGVAIGVDQNAHEQIWVAMTSQGVFDYGKTTSWEEIEHLKLMYNATVVCDPNPYPVHPKRFAEKYHDWYICYFKEMKSLDVLDWKGHTVFADRTKLLDTIATEIATAKLLFRQRPYELEAMIADWQNIYRTTVEEPDGRTKSVWLKKGSSQSDFSFATAYSRIALSRMLGSAGGSLLEPTSVRPTNIRDTAKSDGNIVNETLSQAVGDTFADM